MVSMLLMVVLPFERPCPRARNGLVYVFGADARSSCNVKGPLDRRAAVDSLEVATRTSTSTLRRTRDPSLIAVPQGVVLSLRDQQLRMSIETENKRNSMKREKILLEAWTELYTALLVCSKSSALRGGESTVYR